MEQMNYWQKQGKTPLFAEIDQERPEQRAQAGRLLVIGGQKGSFFAVAAAVEQAKKIGFGTVKVLLPDSLKAKVPADADVVFAPSEAAGGFGKAALEHVRAATEQADYVLVIGDLGKNSETAVLLQEFLKTDKKPVLLTRDAVDLVAVGAVDWAQRENITLCATLPQLQKIFKALYYPKILTLSMPVHQLVETLHKFTITYPLTILTYHNAQVITATGGEVMTTELKDTQYTPISLWSGEWAVKTAALATWNAGQTLAAATTALL